MGIFEAKVGKSCELFNLAYYENIKSKYTVPKFRN